MGDRSQLKLMELSPYFQIETYLVAEKGFETNEFQKETSNISMNVLNHVGDERDRKRSQHVATWTSLNLANKPSGRKFSHTPYTNYC